MAHPCMTERLQRISFCNVIDSVTRGIHDQSEALVLFKLNAVEYNEVSARLC